MGIENLKNNFPLIASGSFQIYTFFYLGESSWDERAYLRQTMPDFTA